MVTENSRRAQPSENGRRVYALLRTLAAWAPTPRGGSYAEAGFSAFARRCHACLAAGRPKPCAGGPPAKCDHCHGTGLIAVKDAMDEPVRNPSQDPRRKVYFGGESGKDEARRRDAVLEKLEHEESVRKGQEAPADEYMAAVERRDRWHRRGSYLELGRALERLRDREPAAYAVALGVAYQPFCEAPVEPVHRVVESACELLAEWMPERVRVPPWVPVYSRDELEARAKVGRDSLWRGRTARHDLRRAERQALAVELAEGGASTTEIGYRLNVHRRTVQRWLADVETAA